MTAAPAQSAVATPLINAPAPGTPLVATNNPLRKQTLLGIAPVVPARSEPPAAASATTARSEPPLAGSESTAAAPVESLSTKSPRRNQTLLGIAPVVPQPAAPSATVTAVPASETAVAEAPVAEMGAPQATVAEPAETASSVSSIVTPAAVATDAPTSTDLGDLQPLNKAAPRRAAVAALSSSHDELPELKPKRSRWPLLLGIAAALALGVVGLRQLDRAPTPVPPELTRPVNAANPVAKPSNAIPKTDDGDDDDDPNTDTAPQPDPLPPEAEPAKGKAEAAPPVAEAPAPSAEAAAPSASATPLASAEKKAGAGGTIPINITTDPPGARLFWKGKEQGTTPFVLEFPVGERHSYELGLPGYTVRKVVIDGSKTDISIGMRPDPAATSGAKPRK